MLPFPLVISFLLGALISGVASQAAEYQQCGGQGWTGPTTCVSGWTCSPVSPPYYYQCLPGSSAPTTTTTTSTSKPITTTPGSSASPAATGSIPKLSTVGDGFRVDTLGGLVFDVAKSTGSITNLNFNGVQYQDSAKLSAINSGLGTSSVSAETIGSYVKITAKSNGLPVTHYYVAKGGEPTIYMATYITGEVDPGELRWLARMKKSVLPTGWHDPSSEIAGCTAFEGSDTFKCSNGQTRCKFYSSDRFIDDIVHGVTGSNVGVWMIMPGNAYETSSGGPFMRDINTQGSDQQELYFYMNSGHIRTEPWRLGLMGPYAMTFTPNTNAPSGNLDTSFFSGLSIQGYVPNNQRGKVSGSATGVPSQFETVLHWYNTQAQYWTKASGGTYTSPLMKPGSYTMKMYRGEFLVAQSSVTVSAGSTVSKDIAATAEPTRQSIFRIGEFDGQPFELKNGDKILRMHPTDPRMGSWGGTYTVGSSTPRDFPMALGSDAGGVATVNFNLAASDVRQLTLRIGTTLSFQNGRPTVKVNGQWTGADPGAPTLIDSRGLTRGGYRGYGDVYTWNIPASALRTGANSLTIGAVGSKNLGSWLAGNYIVDAVELYVS
ncbi:polysaccharide lyase family 4 protein [Serendipita vermifera MAFF 305830]|uniref:rhamnogalacturonan endolyase n=1 Tax=Serendipita vermifera MAFF 305830 TaxID=933852 RepID=A0A0C3BS08_SERVB|nr:polysaccharide lyase family 4 protein [Serendipita vermifera MAFF 305830]